MIRFSCPSCGKHLKAPEHGGGRQTHCPRCNTIMLIPEPPESAEAFVNVGPPPPPPVKESANAFPDFTSTPEDDYPPQRSGLPAGLIAVAVTGVLAILLIVVVVIAGNNGSNSRDNQARKMRDVEIREIRETGSREIGVGDIVLRLIVLVFIIAMYFLPSFIAFFRGHHQRFAILMLNIFAGWTFIAWAASIVWAFTAVESREHVHHHYQHP